MRNDRNTQREDPATSREPVNAPVPAGYAYYHTQPTIRDLQGKDWILSAVTIACLAVIVFDTFLPMFLRAVLIVIPAIAILNLVISSLTVAITKETIEFWFGRGIWHKTIPLGSVIACSPVKNSPLFGWGIRWTPHGWLYNVAGPDAVEVLLQDGRKLRIGTDEPEALTRAITRATR